MPKRKRKQREHTEDWQTIQQYTLWPEQEAYELLRPLVLFGDPAGYLGTSRPTVYATLKRWVEEGVRGLDDKSHARKAPRVVTLEIANEIGQRLVNPLIGEWRMHAALLQIGINISPRTYGRVMAKHRTLYGWDKPKGFEKPKKEMPF